MRFTVISERSPMSAASEASAVAVSDTAATMTAARNSLPPQRSHEHSHDVVFSIVKAIGITAVVVGHAAAGTPIERFVYLFHIALFFFAAGYFFDDRQTARPLAFVGRKLRRLYVPYIVWGSCFVLLHNFFLRLHLIAYDFHTQTPILPYDSGELLRMLGKVFLFDHHEQMLSPYWFLQGMFFGLLLFFSVTYVCRYIYGLREHPEWSRGIFILALFTGALMLNSHPLGFPGEGFLIRTFIIAGLIYLGKLYALFRRLIPLKTSIALLCLSGLILCSLLGCRINIGARIFGNVFLFLPITCAGCYMVLTAAKAIAARNTLPRQMADYTGRHTMAIMLWHIPAFKLVSLLQIGIYGYPVGYLAYPLVIPTHLYSWWIPYTLVGMLIPLGCSLVYDRLRQCARS